jgi:hypothetical protein
VIAIVIEKKMVIVMEYLTQVIGVLIPLTPDASKKLHSIQQKKLFIRRQQIRNEQQMGRLVITACGI